MYEQSSLETATATEKEGKGDMSCVRAIACLESFLGEEVVSCRNLLLLCCCCCAAAPALFVFVWFAAVVLHDVWRCFVLGVAHRCGGRVHSELEGTHVNNTCEPR